MLRDALDWGQLAPLKVRAKTIAEGVYAGTHRSARRGAGIEFGGHREYVPGDDLRYLDRRATMRHGRLLVRQFEMETDRALRLLVDATPSMAFRSTDAPGAKLAYAALIAAALARIALSAGDPVALDWLGGTARSLPSMGGKEAFSRITAALESVSPEAPKTRDTSMIDRALAPIARHARRGSVIVLLSDLVDLPDGALDRFAALGTGGRTALAVRVLDPAEATFPFRGPVRLRATEGGAVTETDAARVRSAYLENLEAIAQRWTSRLVVHGGTLVRATTTDDPVTVLRTILLAIRGGRP